MNVEFRASFAKDLKNISNKDVLKRVRETIEEIELAHSLQDISGLKKLKGASKYFRIRLVSHRTDPQGRHICVRAMPGSQRDLPLLSITI